VDGRCGVVVDVWRGGVAWRCWHLVESTR